MDHRKIDRMMPSTVARRVIFFLLRLTGIPLLLRQTVQRHRVTILCYHEPCPRDFVRHLEILTRKYHIISLRRYLEWRTDPSVRLPTKSLVITFDDGHRSNYQLKDILLKYKVPATIFLCSAIVGTNRHFWWNSVSPREVEKLKRVGDAERRTLLNVRGLDETREHADRQALSREEITELRGILDLQSHTRFHPILPCCDNGRALDEIAQSRHELQARFGLLTSAFAYPNGDYSERDVAFVRQAGYRCALTIDGGYNGRTTDIYRLRRVRMSDTARTSELIVKASGLWGIWERLVRRDRDKNVSTVTGATPPGSVNASA